MNAILNYFVWGRKKNGVFIRAGFMCPGIQEDSSLPDLPSSGWHL